jgi:hexosaminidase
LGFGLCACSESAAPVDAAGGFGSSTGGALNTGGALQGGSAGLGGTAGAVGGTAGNGGMAEADPPVTVDQDPVAALNLIPLPQSVTAGSGHVHLSATTRLAVTAETRPIAEQLAIVLRRSTGLPLEVVETAERRGDIVLKRDAALSALGAEGYRLEVGEDRATLSAPELAGLFYATTTLRQLLPAAVEGSSVAAGVVWRLPRVTIEDAPRFSWRGFSFDVARHFFGVSEVERLIDLAAYHKLNRFHLHLTDDQGWRIVVNSRPNLSSYGGSTQVGGGAGGFFTQAEYTALVQYASERFITVIPEIDVPGHTNAALASYPELNPSGEAPPLYTGTTVGFSSLWLGQQVTTDFVSAVFGEIAALTPGPWIHVGGDEATNTDENQYKDFMVLVDGIVKSHGKTLIGWCEVGTAEISAGSIAQHWHENCAGTTQGVARGMKVVLSPADRAYLDMKYDDETPVGHDWAGLVTVREAYEWQPSLDGIAQDAILGVEAALWTEFIGSREHIDLMVFPRVCGHAEIAWSSGNGRGWDEYRTRLATHGSRLDALGVDYFRAAEVDWVQ